MGGGEGGGGQYQTGAFIREGPSNSKLTYRRGRQLDKKRLFEMGLN